MSTPDLVRAREIYSCPFCRGGSYIQADSHDDSCWIMCSSCQAESPICSSESELEETITRWNFLSHAVAKLEKKKALKEKTLKGNDLQMFLTELQCEPS